ncbi:MAG: methyl-accepting chemotaxis protein [Candidatus Accumulibacter sp.]|jgi:twitching motility protein PilJ|nr:methyl-accepting chemotaxis protein [Accumulibacter sp.]
MASKLNLKKLFFGTKKSDDRAVTVQTPLDTGDRGIGGKAGAGGGGKHPGRYLIAKQLKVLAAALLILLSSIGVIAYRDYRAAEYNAAYTATAIDLGMLSQRIAKATGLAIRGDPLAFGMLRDAHSRFAASLDSLKNGGELGGILVPPSPEGVVPQIDGLSMVWGYTSRNVVQLLRAETNMVIFGKYLRGFDIGTRNGISLGSERVYVATRDDETRRITAALDAVFKDYATIVDGALGGVKNLAEARQAAGRILVDEGDLFNAAESLVIAYRLRGNDGRLIREGALAGLAFLVLVVLALMAGVYVADARRQAEQARKNSLESEMTNRQNQDAILRLMNELGDLADGDLTVTATVSEDITGAIADSINYTVEELRVLVGRINDAAGRVTGATEIAQQTSVELLNATRRQSRVIQEAGRSVLEVAGSMTRASSDADQSARVARHSLTAAGKGTQAVQDSIKGMNEIREQIQETSKRIKRLGESSQEIGEIVELISDITEQTNVLALNAAIQAASAGDAGRGFTVVAEEVQRLAERSGEATKQIAAIVKTIQTDTQSAVSAMEKSTRGVVEGAKLSDAAGQALAEIGAVSQNLADLIERISQATRKQADAATGVAGKMQDILKVTEQTTAGTQRTASAVGELAGLATELKGSVAGFKVG